MLEGIVKNSEDNSGIPFAAVINIDANGNQRNDRYHDEADVNGEFSLVDAEDGDIIQFSAIGFATKQYNITMFSPGALTMSLDPVTYEIDEAVVYGEKDSWFKRNKAIIIIAGIAILVFIAVKTKIFQ